MKISCTLFFTFLLIGCASTDQSVPLTVDQATKVAVRLANDEATTYYNCHPFRDDQPAHFLAGHWLWVERQGVGHSDIQATVELAADGTTNHVDIELSDSQNLPLHY